MDASELRELPRYDWHGRLMFGSDLPVWQAHEAAPLTKRLRDRLFAFRELGLGRESDSAFARFAGREDADLNGQRERIVQVADFSQSSEYKNTGPSR